MRTLFFEPTFGGSVVALRDRPVVPSNHEVVPLQPPVVEPAGDTLVDAPPFPTATPASKSSSALLPPPSLSRPSSPSRVLVTSPDGWPKNTVRTPGGYHVVPSEGGGAKIYAPGSDCQSKDHKSGHCRLGDGTNIFIAIMMGIGLVRSLIEICHGSERVSVRQDAQGNVCGCDEGEDGHRVAAERVAEERPQSSSEGTGSFEWIMALTSAIQGATSASSASSEDCGCNADAGQLLAVFQAVAAMRSVVLDECSSQDEVGKQLTAAKSGST